ncbi:MAG: family N-acetyltransferase [Paucimonas sp.]|nr:family N-acetyltransferase [Paucimonas sp.]
MRRIFISWAIQVKVEISLGDWESQKAQAAAVRREVFIVEQHIPEEMEWDDMDGQSIHAVASTETGNAVGTGRLLPDGHIGRMAVRQSSRGQGVGGQILLALMNAAQVRGDSAVLLHAQSYAVPFYRRFGFEAFGEEFMEAGILHVMMKRML